MGLVAQHARLLAVIITRAAPLAHAEDVRPRRHGRERALNVELDRRLALSRRLERRALGLQHRHAQLLGASPPAARTHAAAAQAGIGGRGRHRSVPVRASGADHRACGCRAREDRVAHRARRPNRAALIDGRHLEFVPRHRQEVASGETRLRVARVRHVRLEFSCAARAKFHLVACDAAAARGSRRLPGEIREFAGDARWFGRARRAGETVAGAPHQ